MKDWNDYPIGTKAHAINGGYWIKNKSGWKWCTGATFPTPGGDVSRIEIPKAAPANQEQPASAQQAATRLEPEAQIDNGTLPVLGPNAAMHESFLRGLDRL